MSAHPCPMVAAVLTDVVTALPPLLPTVFLAKHTAGVRTSTEVKSVNAVNAGSLV
ncbi:hypothetical protein ACFFSH_31700 [Streptomyces filamentosus]|uniref:Uncharacterized protein n=1 Tax=Streptomyces filamentosus TaxID=67294 RepID=A0A919ERG6_STRFL|nr:hypothetical protein [Streptomyces filamentosus]GHG13438.1 hypothetical protein GCM10017667_54130 [Streptomyces filamentosus]